MSLPVGLHAIEMTHDDIAAGQPGSCFACPVVLALRRAFPAAQVVEASPVGIRIDDTFTGTPDDVVTFMHAFDHHGAAFVQPFTFRLHL